MVIFLSLDILGSFMLEVILFYLDYCFLDFGKITLLTSDLTNEDIIVLPIKLSGLVFCCNTIISLFLVL